jgi:putative transposase
MWSQSDRKPGVPALDGQKERIPGQRHDLNKCTLQHARFLLHDWDAKFSGPFDQLFRTEEVRVIRTPIRAPRANAFAERFVRTVRSECLDHILIYRRRHLERVLTAYVDHYMEERPHRGLDLATPRGVSAPEARDPKRKRIERRDVLGGLIHEYRWAA